MSKLRSVETTLTSWEAFNYILHGLVNEAIEVFQLDPKVKLTAFQIWTAYLRKHESAFYNDQERVLPKLPNTFFQADYNVISNMAKKRKLSENEEAHGNKIPISEAQSLIKIKRRNKKFRYRICKLGRLVLFIIIFCAINHSYPSFQPSDFLRAIDEGRFSYYECRHFLPENLSEEEKLYFNQLYATCICGCLTHLTFCRYLHQFSVIYKVYLNPPNWYILFEQYVTELALPKEVYKFVERLFSICPTDFELRKYTSGVVESLPYYDGRAMAYIIFALKLIFGLNGVTESAMSASAKKVNAFMEEKNIKSRKLFVWSEWVEYLEARKLLLLKYNGQLHFQSENKGNDYLSSRVTPHFSNLKENVYNYHPKEKKLNAEEMNKLSKEDRRHLKYRNFARKLMEKKQNSKNPSPKIEFPPSLTPNTTNLEVLRSSIALPEILNEDFRLRNIKYLIKGSKLKKKFRKNGFEVKSVEAPSNISMTYITYKKSRKLFKRSAKLIEYIFSTDEQTYLENLKKEAKLKETNIKKARHDPMMKQKEISSKQKIKKIMKKKRASYIPNEDDFFSEIESSSDSEPDSDTDVTYHRPNFEYWTYIDRPDSLSKDIYDLLSVEFPYIFKWLLETCSAMLQMKPIFLYFELLTIEVQFLYILKPMYKIKNELKYQNLQEIESSLRGMLRSLHNKFIDGNIMI
ncbi:TATA box-binding protein-associated factor RNA polymerase I subunit B-like [Culicoides brevitarsis]|uniref:TATA box-binding protein-associated factor RNA polymerase I subunit B-like n=1 Tax=Culicoides brevitarsis TaxID=469753 RepID=UPI00307B4717